MKCSVIALWCVVALATAADSAMITLHETALVAGDIAILGDIADIQSTPAVRERIAAIPVQDMPDLAKRTVRSDDVRVVLRRRVPDLMLTVHGACQVSRSAEDISAAALDAAARSALAVLHPHADVTFIRNAAPISIPAGGGEPELIAESLGGDGIGEAPYRLRVLRHGRELGRTLVIMKVAVVVDHVVAVRPIAKGATIDAADLRLERRTRQHGSEPLSDLDQAVGQLARCDIGEGAPLSTSMLRPKPAVEGGQPVSLVYVHGQFQLSGSAVAMSDAVVGELINVRRDTDGKLVRAKVASPGVVEIEQ